MGTLEPTLPRTLAFNLPQCLAETETGQLDISALSATGGITYKDAENQFAASGLFYDAARSLITAYGDNVQSCLLNGTVVDAIEYSLKTGSVNAKINGPGTLEFE